MNRVLRKVSSTLLLTMASLFLASTLYGGKNEVMGELRFEGKSGVERSSGVWVDSEYVGYLKELKGSRKILLLPGEHVVTVRQDGFQEFTARLSIQPKQTLVVKV